MSIEGENSIINRINKNTQKHVPAMEMTQNKANKPEIHENSCMQNKSTFVSLLQNIFFVLAIEAAFCILMNAIQNKTHFSFNFITFSAFIHLNVLIASCFVSSFLLYTIYKLNFAFLSFLYLFVLLVLQFSIIYAYFDGLMLRLTAFTTVLISIFKLYSFLCFTRGKDKITQNSKISFEYFLQFLCSPAIVFDTEYARKKQARLSFIFKHLIGLVLGMLCFYTVLFFISFPTILKMKTANNYGVFMQNYFCLSSSIVMLFTSFFYLLFVSYQPILNEISHFEIELYDEWWNARDAAEFWRCWNIPVHQFIKVHIYGCLATKGIDKYVSMLASVFFSAIFHELLISLTLKKFNGYFMLGMLTQLPLRYLTSKCKNLCPAYAKWLFLVIFTCVGQTITFYLIFRDVISKEYVL